MNALRRTIHPQIRVIDEKRGLAEYIASDETLDSYREVIKASGWKFDRFQKNAPFVDSHNYESIDRLLGSVMDFTVKGKQLVETVQWAVEVEGNRLAQIGWAMTKAGHLKAVSVGFYPVRWVNAWDSGAAQSEFLTVTSEMGFTPDTAPRTVYLEQQQIELSAVIIGANPNAVARSFRDGLISEDDLQYLSSEVEKTVRGPALADSPADPHLASPAQLKFLDNWLANIWQAITSKN